MVHSYLLCRVFDFHLNNWQDTLMLLMWLLSSQHTIYTPACKYRNRSILYSKIYHNIQVNGSATLFCCESVLILNSFFALVLNVKAATGQNNVDASSLGACDTGLFLKRLQLLIVPPLYLFSCLPQLKRIIEELAKEI